MIDNAVTITETDEGIDLKFPYNVPFQEMLKAEYDGQFIPETKSWLVPICYYNEVFEECCNKFEHIIHG